MEIKKWHFKSRDKIFLLWLENKKFEVGDYWQFEDYQVFKKEMWCEFCEMKRYHPQRIHVTLKMKEQFYEFVKNKLNEQLSLF